MKKTNRTYNFSKRWRGPRDLMAFNEEKLVRSISESKIPIISAIGHETDVTLCDFAST